MSAELIERFMTELEHIKDDDTRWALQTAVLLLTAQAAEITEQLWRHIGY